MFDNPLIAITNIVSAAILFTAATFTTYRVYRGSKSGFAYILLFFTFANSVTDTLYAYIYAFPNVFEIEGKAYIDHNFWE